MKKTMLTFGTGGMRGRLGEGVDHLNSYMVTLLTQAIAQYLSRQNNPSVVIAYDSRQFSEKFASEVAQVFTANGVRVHLFKECRGVPMLSFAVRQLQATAGVIITASHNPPDYNGYKLYNTDGSQITDSVANAIIAIRENVNNIKTMPVEEALQQGLLSYIDEQMDWLYIEALSSVIMRPALINANAQPFTIVYSALHGTGGQVIPSLLRRYGFNVVCVAEQQEPDGWFPTVASPNPEDPDSFTLALKKAKEVNAPLVLITDPDADRIGVATYHNGDYKLLTGNEIGSLMLNYRCFSLQEQGVNLNNGYFVNTVVSSHLQQVIAQHYGLQSFSVLTGFKNIANVMAIEEPLKDFIFACEESYGVLVTTLVRDKDAQSAALVLAEMALYYFSLGQSLQDALQQIFKQFGEASEGLLSVTLEGEAGNKTIQAMMQQLRTVQPSSINAAFINRVDYLVDDTGLDKNDMIELNDGRHTKVMVRPSGTEPKIKFYLLTHSSQALQQLKDDINRFTAEFLVG